MRNPRYLPLLGATMIAAALFAACSSSGSPTRGPLPTVERAANPTPTPTMTLVEAEDGAIQMKLHMSRNGSQQAGTLSLTQVGMTTEMLITLAPAAPVGQPVTMRRGTCESPTGYIRDLDAVVGGVMRQTFEDMPIGAFAMGDITVIVAPGYGSLGAVAACAEVPRLDRPDLPGFSTRR